MARWTRWLGIGASVGIISALVPVVRGSVQIESPLAKLSKLTQRTPPKPPDLSKLDLLRLDLRPNRVMAPLDGGKTAELTLDSRLQRTVAGIMKRYRVPEAGVVLTDVRTADVLVYASYVAEGERFDVNARAEAPAASVFKVVTSAALVEKAGLNRNTEQCYHGGKSRIQAEELNDDPLRDKWCATLGIAVGRSLNVVMARLAQKHLTQEDLLATAGAFGFGAPVPFPVKNDAPGIEMPDDPLEFARSAAGFWHTTLSPLAGSQLAQTIANGGVALEPRIVKAVYQGEDKVWERPSGDPKVLRRAVKLETAREVGKMMTNTVDNGSAFKAFHDKAGRSYLPDISVAGKTGTLTKYETNRFYTWFVGYAPADKPEVAVAALVVNTPLWQIKGPDLARDVLRAYFAKKGSAGVTYP